MKKSLIYTLLTVAALNAVSVGTAATSLFPVVVGGRWGYVNKSGEPVINPQFDRAESFRGRPGPGENGPLGLCGRGGQGRHQSAV